VRLLRAELSKLNRPLTWSVAGTAALATWVQGWMGFPAGLASITALPTNFWSRFINAGGSPPSHLFGLTGLCALLLACAAGAALVFQRADVSG
jgi:hypothetical protein